MPIFLSLAEPELISVKRMNPDSSYAPEAPLLSSDTLTEELRPQYVTKSHESDVSLSDIELEEHEVLSRSVDEVDAPFKREATIRRVSLI